MPDPDDWDDDESDPDSDDGMDTIPCPHCGSDIYDDSVRCPECGEYLTRETSALSGHPMWVVALGLAGVIAVIGCLLLLG